MRNHERADDYFIGTFSEFFLTVAMCEEAVERVRQANVVPFTSIVHAKAERPLHRDGSSLLPDEKAELINLCHQIHPSAGLGYKKTATMVVLYRNAPNTTPLLFRGSLRQSPFRGIFPRSDDLPY